MHKKGFTLVEMLIVIVVIGILASALIPKITGIRQKAKNVARISYVREIQTALNLYYTDHGKYPDSGSSRYVCLGEFTHGELCDLGAITSSPRTRGQNNVYEFYTNYLAGSNYYKSKSSYGWHKKGQDAPLYVSRENEEAYLIVITLDGTNQSCKGLSGLIGTDSQPTSNNYTRNSGGLTVCSLYIKNGEPKQS